MPKRVHLIQQAQYRLSTKLRRSGKRTQTLLTQQTTDTRQKQVMSIEKSESVMEFHKEEN